MAGLARIAIKSQLIVIIGKREKYGKVAIGKARYLLNIVF